MVKIFALVKTNPSVNFGALHSSGKVQVLLRVPESIVFSVRFLCITGYCLVSSLLFLAFVSIELRILCAATRIKSRKSTRIIRNTLI
jgi:hypothetical protein